MGDLHLKIVHNARFFCQASSHTDLGSSKNRAKKADYSTLKLHDLFMAPRLEKFHASKNHIKKYQLKKEIKKENMEVVKGMEIERYMGRWYEIASVPWRFEPKSGIDTRATYTLNPDGTAHVLNETWTDDGNRAFIEGTAWKVDPKNDDVKLKAKFYLPPFLPVVPVIGDYSVLYIDEDYQHAVIGQPSRKYLWILGRQRRVDEETYNQLVEKAKKEGYDVSKLRKTTHSDAPPESENVATDTKGIWWIKCIFGK